MVGRQEYEKDYYFTEVIKTKGADFGLHFFSEIEKVYFCTFEYKHKGLLVLYPESIGFMRF